MRRSTRGAWRSATSTYGCSAFGHKDSEHRWDLKLVLQKLLKEISSYRDDPKIALPRIDAILVTGDIAWSGKAEQYNEAKDWLQKVAAAVGLDLRIVFAVPGNHDVDRDVDKKELSLKLLVRTLREGNGALDEVLDDEACRTSLARRQGHGFSFGAVVQGDDGYLRARVFPRRLSEKNGDYRLDPDNVHKDKCYAEHILARLRRR